MRRSTFTEEQIAYALREAEAGMPVLEVCRSVSQTESARTGLLPLQEPR
jgi:putative transposase